MLLLLPAMAWFVSSYGPNGGDPAIYKKHCASCHGQNGEGLRALYPPLKDSDYMSARLNNLPCLIANGVRGNIVSKDGATNIRMVPVNLSTSEMTTLITYLHHKWGTGKSVVSEQTVSQCLQHCP